MRVLLVLDLYLYEKALRRGYTVVIVQAPDVASAEQARAALRAAGAESLDAARQT